MQLSVSVLSERHLPLQRPELCHLQGDTPEHHLPRNKGAARGRTGPRVDSDPEQDVLALDPMRRIPVPLRHLTNAAQRIDDARELCSVER